MIDALCCGTWHFGITEEEVLRSVNADVELPAGSLDEHREIPVLEINGTSHRVVTDSGRGSNPLPLPESL